MSKHNNIHSKHNIFLDLIPLVIFFAVYYLNKNIFIATGACIIASWIVVAIVKIKYARINKNIWLNTILITVFGGLTIILHNKTFVMLKPTLLFWIIGASLIISQMAGKNLIQASLGSELNLNNRTWNQLSLIWSLFFVVMGFLNLVVAFTCSEYVWVKFKVFGTTSLTLIFMLITISIAYFRHSPKNSKT